MHNDNDRRTPPTSTKNIQDSVLTSICFTTLSRADFSLLISLGVSGLFLDNYHFVSALAKDSDGLGSRLITNDFLHLVLLFRSSRGHRRSAL
jgi:hypothetical protein